MTNLTVLVVDDEKHAREDLAWMLGEIDAIREVISAASGTEALRIISSSSSIDAVFLDVQMPHFSGMDVLGVLGQYKHPPAVALVTAFDAYAVDAFSFDVCDYLLKPVEQKRLEETIRRIQSRRTPEHTTTDSTQGEASSDDLLPVLSGKLGSKAFEVARSKVVLVEAAGDYVEVFTNEKSYLVRESISTLTSAWSAYGFVRIHRSFLVRQSAITEVCRVDSSRIVKILGKELPISRRYNRLLKDS